MKLLQNFTFYFLKFQIKFLSLFSKKWAGNRAFEIFCTPYQSKSYHLTTLFKEAEPLTIAVQGKSIAGYRWNKGADKRILIAHGFNSSSNKFEHFVKDFISLNYEVISFDAPAHGNSSGNKLTALLYKKTIEQIIAELGPFDAFLGHSFGGLAICLAAAELPNNQEYKIIMVAPASNTLSLLDMFYNRMDIDDKQIQHHFAQNIIIRSGKTPEWFSIERCMDTLKSNILWVHDHTDKITPIADAKYIKKKKHPNIEFFFTNGLGHSKIYRNEAVIKKINAFLIKK